MSYDGLHIPLLFSNINRADREQITANEPCCKKRMEVSHVIQKNNAIFAGSFLGKTKYKLK
jgi:hypothetical protein